MKFPDTVMKTVFDILILETVVLHTMFTQNISQHCNESLRWYRNSLNSCVCATCPLKILFRLKHEMSRHCTKTFAGFVILETVAFAYHVQITAKYWLRCEQKIRRI